MKRFAQFIVFYSMALCATGASAMPYSNFKYIQPYQFHMRIESADLQAGPGKPSPHGQTRDCVLKGQVTHVLVSPKAAPLKPGDPVAVLHKCKARANGDLAISGGRAEKGRTVLCYGKRQPNTTDVYQCLF